MSNTQQTSSAQEDLVTRLRKRSEIRKQIKTRKSVQQGEPDRICELLDEAAVRIENLEAVLQLAQIALNTAPNFRVMCDDPQMRNSYNIASKIDAAIKAKGGAA